MKGMNGRLLEVDLSAGTRGSYEIPETWQHLLLGGRALGARILRKELSGDETADSADNLILLLTGPFQGTGLTGAGRHLIMSISPKTGAVSGSYTGGYFGYELARSGYDGILVRGVAASPVYLSLLDGKAEIHEASDLWGKGTGETEEILTARHERCRVASIGIAGEKQVQMACIIHDRSRAAGRPGFGAVMGGKRLKAIVVRGHRSKPLHDEVRFARERSAYVLNFEHPSFKRLGEYGTPMGIGALNELGILPTKNFREGVFDAAERIGAERLHDTMLVGRESCAGCPIRCKRVVKTTYQGVDVIPAFGGPEYETIAAFGSLCLNDNLDSIALANQLCNDYGIDTISAGVAIAFLMEASEKGLLKGDVVSWGDASAVVAWIRKIALREGVGDRIADGLEDFAKELGADFAMTIKGVELPMHEPRGKLGLGISYATSPRGATHTEGFQDNLLEIENPTPELGVTEPYSRFDLESKPNLVRLYEDLQGFENSLILCLFTARAMGPQYFFPEIRSLLEAATGVELSVSEMLDVGARGKALMHLLAGDAGYTLASHRLPARFAKELPRGASAGHAIDPDDLGKAIAEYYELRGYGNDGPTEETLEKLQLGDVLADHATGRGQASTDRKNT